MYHTVSVTLMWRPVTKSRLHRDFAALIKRDCRVSTSVPQLDPHVKGGATTAVQQHHPGARLARLKPSGQANVPEDLGRLFSLVGRTAEKNWLAATRRRCSAMFCNPQRSTKCGRARCDGRQSGGDRQRERAACHTRYCDRWWQHPHARTLSCTADCVYGSSRSRPSRRSLRAGAGECACVLARALACIKKHIESCKNVYPRYSL